jgi:hypothetical protein
MVFPLGPEPHTGAVIEPESFPFRLFRWHFETLLAPDPLDALVVDPPAFPSKKSRDSAIAVPTKLRSELNDSVGEPSSHFRGSCPVSLGGTVLPQQSTGTAF